eukprot:TRINITY_DN1326_c0_g1_i1.p1 TRINITY_DN1326_c0_g1~~TRINITY_DN1326_c0_g1_i1.p1  ORF type:complete len:152 (+),score=23.43 TRINITY_DN1326_c0_g1_i1:473-928(+)
MEVVDSLEVELFIDQKALLDLDLICPICHCVFTKPVTLLADDNDCQHVLCQGCFALSHELQNRRVIKSAFLDLKIQRIVFNQVIRCPRSEDGCTETGPVGTFLNEHKAKCVYVKVDCNCGVQFFRKDRFKHALECEVNSLVFCPFRSLAAH